MTQKAKTPSIGWCYHPTKITVVNIQRIEFDPLFIYAIGTPHDLAIRQIEFAEYLRKKNNAAFFAGIVGLCQDSREWCFEEFEDNFSMNKVQELIQSYLENFTTYVIDYE